jgi:hypothetical protein
MRVGILNSAGCGLLAFAALLVVPNWARLQQSAAAQSTSQAAPKAVALVSDACPAVQRGGRIALDWNPNFDPEGAVSGLRHFELIFRPLDQDGVSSSEPGRSFFATTKGTPGAISALGNGFYHIELTVPLKASFGVFRLVGAGAGAQLYPEYKDLLPLPLMTDSPVRTRLCVTVVPAQQSQSTTVGN